MTLKKISKIRQTYLSLSTEYSVQAQRNKINQMPFEYHKFLALPDILKIPDGREKPELVLITSNSAFRETTAVHGAAHAKIGFLNHFSRIL